MYIALLIHVVIVLSAVAFTATLFYYYRTYSLPQDKKDWVIVTFTVIFVFLSAFSTILFFQVPWKSVFAYLILPI